MLLESGSFSVLENTASNKLESGGYKNIVSEDDGRIITPTNYLAYCQIQMMKRLLMG